MAKTFKGPINSEWDAREVGTIRVRKGSPTNGANTNDFYLTALSDVNHASMTLTNWFTTIRNEHAKKRRVGPEWVQFKYDEAQKNYHCDRNTVDNNNNDRQGWLSFEETFLPNDWNLRQFGHVLSTCQTKLHLGKDIFAPLEEEKT